MHNYKYKTVDASGRTQSGVLAAKSEVEVASYLREKDLFAISIEKMAKQNLLTKDVSIGSKRVKIVHLVIFCRQLSAMLKAGMPLDKSLTTQIRQTESKVMKKALITLSGQIQQGVLMSRAMYDQPNIFPKILINSVEAGEKTGHLDDALVKMGDYFYKQDIIKKKIKGAMWYPMA
ncbi:MAG: type II secretion system F family protein, partial [Defluviitaleaceae bacterium]|nr:type II secretion system F family protein [Defluviitaleaceae bacterium]